MSRADLKVSSSGILTGSFYFVSCILLPMTSHEKGEVRSPGSQVSGCRRKKGKEKQGEVMEEP